MANHPARLLILSLLAPAAGPAAAQIAGSTLAQPSPAQLKNKAVADKPAGTCPEYGVGYRRLESGTCVKIGGYLRLEAGTTAK